MTILRNKIIFAIILAAMFGMGYFAGDVKVTVSPYPPPVITQTATPIPPTPPPF